MKTFSQNYIEKVTDSISKKYDLKKTWIFMEYASLGDILIDLSLFRKFKEIHCKNSPEARIVYITAPYGERVRDVFPHVVDEWIIFNSPDFLLFNEICAKNYEFKPGNIINIAPSLYGSSPIGMSCQNNRSNYLKQVLLNMPIGSEQTLPRPRTSGFRNSHLQEILEVNSGKKIVLLIPHAQSCRPLPVQWVQHLINELSSIGHHVVMDDYGDKYGSLRQVDIIKADLHDLFLFSGSCAATITYRSGLSDLLSISGTRQIVMYPKSSARLYGFADLADINLATTIAHGLSKSELSVFDFWGVEDMEGRHDIVDFQMRHSVERVLQHMY